MSEQTLSIGRLCACMGRQGLDPYCPCEMQRMKLDGFYNCYGDKEAMAKREEEAQERLSKAMAAWNNRTGDAK